MRKISSVDAGNTLDKMLYFLSGPPVAEAGNPSYSVGRDQEDCSLKPALANNLRDPI
jgi:hypothetical protein